MSQLLRKLSAVWLAISSRLRGLVLHVWRPTPPRFHAARVNEFPSKLKSHRIYLAGENGHLWAAAMLCPCGCNETIELNLLPQVRPRWTVHQHDDGTATLMPSVWRQKGCQSHFFLRHGQIEWCLPHSEAAGFPAPSRNADRRLRRDADQRP